MSWFLFAVRRLREDRVATLVLAVVLAATAFTFGSMPGVAAGLADTALRGDVGAGSPFARNLQLLEAGRIGDGPSGGGSAGEGSAFTEVDERGATLQADLPATVRPLVSERVTVTDSPRYAVTTATPDPSTVRFRMEAGAERRVRIVDGRMATGAVRTVDPPPPAPGEPEHGPVTVVEAMLSVEAANALGVGVGDTVTLRADPRDPFMNVAPEALAAFDVVGTYEVPDPAAPQLLDDPALVRPSHRLLGFDTRILDVTALLGPDAYGALLRVTAADHVPLRYTWRYLVDPSRLDAASLDALVADLRQLDTRYPSSEVQPRGSGTAMRTGLLALVEQHRLRARAAAATVSVMAVGAGAIAGIALGLVAVLTSRRRRVSLALWLARGGSRGQVVASVMTESLIVAVPAVAIGAALAAVLPAVLPAGPGDPSEAPAAVALAALVGVVGVTLVVAASVPRTTRPPSARATEAAGGPGRRRVVAEVLVIGLAVLGVVLLRERGVSAVGGAPGGVPGGAPWGAPGSGSSAPPGSDPFVAAVPALVGIAAAIVAIRVLPLPMRLVGWLAAGRRGLVALLAVRRATTAGSAAAVLAVLLATTTVGVFASSTLHHLEQAADSAGWHDVGADFLVRAGSEPLPTTFDPLQLPGADAVAPAFRSKAVIYGPGTQVELLAIDPVAFRDVVRDTAGAVELPIELFGRPADRVAAIVSDGLAPGRTPLARGDRFELVVEGRRTAFVAADVRASFPTMPAGSRFIVVSRTQLDAVAPHRLETTTVFVRAPVTAAAGLTAAVRRMAPGAAVDSRADLTERLRTAPVASAVASGVAAVVSVAVVYAAIAVIAAIVLGSAARSSEAAHLRVLGLARAQALSLSLAEHGPIVAVGFGAGVALGIGMFVGLRPGLGLDVVTGSTAAVPLGVIPAHLGVLLCAIVSLVALGVAIGELIGRRVVAATAIRRGIE